MYWSLKSEILKQVQKESNLRWSKTPPIPIPKYNKVEIKKTDIGWYNLLSSVLTNLKP